MTLMVSSNVQPSCNNSHFPNASVSIYLSDAGVTKNSDGNSPSGNDYDAHNDNHDGLL